MGCFCLKLSLVSVTQFGFALVCKITDRGVWFGMVTHSVFGKKNSVLVCNWRRSVLFSSFF